MVTLTGIMTAVTISKSIIFTKLFLSTKTIWHSIQSIQVSPTELVTAFALVSLFHTFKLCLTSTHVQLPSQKVNKFLYIRYVRVYRWIQSQQEKIILYFHSKICKGPAINNSSRSNHRKCRKRSSGSGQWRLRKYKVKLKQFKSCPCEATVIQAAMAKSKRKPKVTFDVESKPVGMDTQASKSICVDPSMMTNLRPANIRVLGIANTQTLCKWQGDWNLSITDDNGVTTTEVIPDTPLVTKAAKSILSPQHFAKKYPVGSEARLLCRATQYHDRCIFRWGDKNERVLTIDNDSSDVPTFYSVAHIASFASFMEGTGADKCHIFALESTVMSQPDTYDNNNIPIVSDDEESYSSNLSGQDRNDNSISTINEFQTNDTVQTKTKHIASVPPKVQNGSEENVSDLSHNMSQPSQEVPRDSDLEAKVLSDSAGYLRWHYKLNHLSFRKMKALATLGIIPRKYKHMEPPVCKACQYGKRHKRPWRTKGATVKIKSQ